MSDLLALGMFLSRVQHSRPETFTSYTRELTLAHTLVVERKVLELADKIRVIFRERSREIEKQIEIGRVIGIY